MKSSCGLTPSLKASIARGPPMNPGTMESGCSPIETDAKTRELFSNENASASKNATFRRDATPSKAPSPTDNKSVLSVLLYCNSNLAVDPSPTESSESLSPGSLQSDEKPVPHPIVRRYAPYENVGRRSVICLPTAASARSVVSMVRPFLICSVVFIPETYQSVLVAPTTTSLGK